MQVYSGILQPLMPEQQLNGAKIRSGLKHVRRKTMAQCMRSDPFSKSGTQCSFVARVPNDLIRDGTFGLDRLKPAREQVDTRLKLACPPILTQSFKQLLCQGQIAIARSFPLMHMN